MARSSACSVGERVLQVRGRDLPWATAPCVLLVAVARWPADACSRLVAKGAQVAGQAGGFTALEQAMDDAVERAGRDAGGARRHPFQGCYPSR
jgi:hypothetical protein